MKKAFDQTVRDLKREVNKKVLKVPGIEQKVLDATSNEPWGPHGTLLADIANASRNYHECQLIMGVIWKRINDTGKNWRHVYKGLTVLEYLVANGSERVIDEIREHAYQISTLSDFQYIDSSGKDQGNNVRRKSQSLVQLVNDKERIAEVRQKAAANRDKFRSASSTGGMYRPNSYSGGYGDRFDDDRNGHGKDRDSGYREDDRYGRYGDSYNRDGDRNSRNSDERYDRDGYRDDDYHGRRRSFEGQKFGSRSKSYDRDMDRSYEDDGNYSSRDSGARADERSQDERRLDRKFSEQNHSAPPSYEEAVSGGRSPAQSEKGVPAVNDSASPPPTLTIPGQSPSLPSLNRSTTSSPVTHNAPAPVVRHDASVPPVHPGLDSVDEFDPRGPVSVPAPPTYTTGSAGDFLSEALALVPVSSAESSAAPQSSLSASAPAFDQGFEDPFGDTPFRAVSHVTSNSVQPQKVHPTHSYQPSTSQSPDPAISSQHSSTESSFPGQQNQDLDILAGILPLTDDSQASYLASSAHTHMSSDGGINYQPGAHAPSGQITQQNSGYFQQQVPVNSASFHLAHQASLDATMQYNNGGLSQPGSFQDAPHISTQNYVASTSQHHNGGFIPRTSSAPLPIEHNRESFLPQYSPAQFAPQASGVLSGAVASKPGQFGMSPQPAKDKFETKSTIWTDTLSRGLVNLNISGSKSNPLADIGVDFDALNRKEKRMEKQSAAPPISTVSMGKAMGSGSGMGRAGAGAVRPPVNPMVGSGAGMPSYGGMNQQAVGMNRAQVVGMNMGIGQGPQGQRPPGGIYGPQQPIMGGGSGYGPQQPMIGIVHGHQRPMYQSQPPMMGQGYNPQQPYGRGYQ
uniref:ENTH domain-containing protein n=1 Tax=Kalanchoe fedtschenkoi TaxID=63787 RepID=A0A7N0UA29_KALFE